VEQFDTLVDNLTVQDMLAYTANMKLPHTKTKTVRLWLNHDMSGLCRVHDYHKDSLQSQIHHLVKLRFLANRRKWLLSKGLLPR
jgi:hypothetical protein